MTEAVGKRRVQSTRGEGSDLPAPGPGIPDNRGQLLATRDGVLIFVWMDVRVLNWDDESGEPGADARGDLWSIRSLDGGATWVDRQRLFQGVCGHPPINMIETFNGRIVVTNQYYLRHPGRNVVRVYSSADAGKSWRGSNIIDLGATVITTARSSRPLFNGMMTRYGC